MDTRRTLVGVAALLFVAVTAVVITVLVVARDRRDTALANGTCLCVTEDGGVNITDTGTVVLESLQHFDLLNEAVY